MWYILVLGLQFLPPVLLLATYTMNLFEAWATLKHSTGNHNLHRDEHANKGSEIPCGDHRHLVFEGRCITTFLPPRQ